MFAADLLVFSSVLSAAWCQSFFNVSHPKTLNSTSGSCLLIPCLFSISKEKENILDNSSVGTWRRASLWSLYDTDKFTNVHRQMEPALEVVGDLQKKNCTSVMRNLTSQHSDRYYLKLQTKGFSVTETKAVQIHVSDSLAEPNVNVPELKEGEEVNLTCIVPAPCPSHPPNVTWVTALGANVTQRSQLNADGTHSVSAILKLVPSFRHHELKVNCVSISPLHREDKPLLSHKTIILNVKYAPKKTWISLTGSVWLGNNVTLTCQSSANPPATYRWFMKRAGVEEEVAVSHVLSFTAAHVNTGEYICEAQNPQGAMNSTNLQITVPGISFSAFLLIIAALSLPICALLALVILKIYRRSKCRADEMIISETSQDQNMYANVSAAKNQQLESKPGDDRDFCSINPECTIKEDFPDESIYANC